MARMQGKAARQPVLEDGAVAGTLGQLSNQAYERLRAAISEGQLPPSVVIREADLAREYGMSRTPVREALHRLLGEGLIRPAGPGRYVTLQLGLKELTDIYQVREALVGMAARLAAQQRSRVDLARFEDLLEAIDRACEAGLSEEADALIRSFHHAIAKASGNDNLRSMLDRVTDLFPYKALAVTHTDWRAWLQLEHRRLTDAIASQDAELAEGLARKLIAKSLAIRIEDFRKREQREPARSSAV